ncbi:helix-turn-helix domain-containing protein [Streptomyces sp. NPDC002886]|uniref:helix-turn-helix domain-containing protein n=1 Tax=Streptomyces sp. NPDC002886 TaxID=3364667 RepID=UPI0036756852
MTQSVAELGLPTPKERRRLREAADLTHEEVAAAVGVTSNTVRSWETGRTHPRGRKLEAYSKLLTRLAAEASRDPAPAGPTARGEGSAARDGSGGGSGRGPDQGPDRSPERGSDRNSDRNSGRSPDRSSDRGPDRGSDRGSDQSPERGSDRNSDRSPDQGSDQSPDRGSDQGPERESDRNSGPGSGRNSDRGTAAAARPDQADAPEAGSATDRTRGRADSTGTAAAATGTSNRPTPHPAWANGTATPQSGANPAGAPGASATGSTTAAGSATTGPDGTDTDAASAPGATPGSTLGSAALADAGSGLGSGSEAESDADSDVDSDTAAAAEAPEGRFGLRMMRGLTRPVGAQTRPKAAVKRASKPPVGTPRHESKSPVRAGAGTGGGHGGGGRATLRPGGPALPSTATNTGTGTPPDTDSATGGDSEPRSGKAAGPGGGNPAGPGTEAAARTSTTGPDTAAVTGPGSGTATRPDSERASEPDSASGSALDAPPDSASGSAPDSAHPSAPGEGATKAGPPAAAADADPAEAPEAPPKATPTSAFDALYDRTAPALARQAYLLTGRHALACEAVERAFQLAWDRWPEVATDPDPVGWVRAATYEYALSPWHRFRRSHRHPDEPPADPADRVLLDAMLELPPAHRRTVLLYDGVGLDLPDTAAETEASTPTAGSRLVNAHADLADVLPELDGVAPAKQSAVLRERLGTLRPPGRLEPRAAAVVRLSGEHRTRLWTRAVVGVSAVIAAATAYTWVTAPTEYEPPRAPGASVSGVPPHSGPQQLTDEGRQLHDKLLSDPSAGPSRISPSLE